MYENIGFLKATAGLFTIIFFTIKEDAPVWLAL